MTVQEITKVSSRKVDVPSKVGGDAEPQRIVLPAAVVGEEGNDGSVSTEVPKELNNCVQENQSHRSSGEQGLFLVILGFHTFLSSSSINLLRIPTMPFVELLESR